MSSILLGIIIVVTGLLALYWIFYGQRKYNEAFTPKRNVELKAILFDMDGVLIDSFDLWYGAFNGLKEKYGLKRLSLEDFKKNVWGTSTEKNAKKHFKGVKVEEIKANYSKAIADNLHKSKLMPMAKEILKLIKDKNVKLGLVTNTSKELVIKALEAHGIDTFFDAIVTADDAERPKPYPDPVIKLCKNLGVEPQEAMLVGDTKNDYLAGKGAGCVVVGFNTKGDLMISKLSDLENLI